MQEANQAIQRNVSSLQYSSRLRAFLHVAMLPLCLTGFTSPSRADEEEIAARKVKLMGAELVKDREGRTTSILIYPFSHKVSDRDIETVDFAALTRLKSLWVDHPGITDRSLMQFAKAPNVSVLFLKKAKITDEGLARFLKAQRSLSFLSCEDVPITDRGLAGIGEVAGLGCLELSNIRIGDKGVKHIARLSKLFALQLRATDITDAAIIDLTKLAGLTFLCLDETKITDDCIPQLCAIKKLRFLEIRSTKLTDDGIKTLKRALPKLRIVH